LRNTFFSELHFFIDIAPKPMLKNILLADSSGGQAEKMLDKMLDMPMFQQSSVTVLHVVPEKNNADEMEKSREEGIKQLAKTVEALYLKERNIMAVNTLIKEGDPKTTVCQVADELESDLIIMGSRGLQRLQSILANSVSQYVFQLSSRPMLLVKDDIFIKRIKRVLVGLENSESSREGLILAARMLRNIPGAQLQLTRVSKNFSARTKLSVADAQKDSILAEAIKVAKRENVEFQCFAGTGSKPGKEMCAIAEEINSDMIVVGSPDRRPSVARNLVDLDRLLGTSVSDSIRIRTSCPVLFVRKAE
jgi:nucleotide-binding universal stress UspA family protein